ILGGLAIGVDTRLILPWFRRYRDADRSPSPFLKREFLRVEYQPVRSLHADLVMPRVDLLVAFAWREFVAYVSVSPGEDQLAVLNAGLDFIVLDLDDEGSVGGFDPEDN